MWYLLAVGWELDGNRFPTKIITIHNKNLNDNCVRGCSFSKHCTYVWWSYLNDCAAMDYARRITTHIRAWIQSNRVRLPTSTGGWDKSRLRHFTGYHLTKCRVWSTTVKTVTLTWCDGLFTSMTEQAIKDGRSQVEHPIMPARSKGRGLTE